MMIGFCKGVHTLLGFPDPEERRKTPVAPPLPPPPPSLWRCWSISSRDGEGLRIIAVETAKPANVVEKTITGRPQEKPDPGGRGLHECCYDDGLRLCTESLGSESCCDGSVLLDESSSGAGEAEACRRLRKGRSRGRMEERVFPPPLSWLAGNGGRRSKYLVPERKDGRLVIKLETVDRPAIFAATREDGRLLLHPIEPETEEEEEETERDVEVAQSAEEEEEGERGQRGQRWEWRMGEIEGVRRCQESVSGYKVVPPWWNPQFVTTA